ncbi:MinD/ParA family protein [Ramlibacter sp. G-1-2-2]|uniref:MinD/ParA family protein n=1 Tax=Ramlibacter agri TaxID=2728837 RepID=A0A848GZ46_9BURK|nr:hypothetical protein [Ramlibacter agri]NML43427.1 MinD/ParA family protein [Ramlibacter agri]
MLDQGHDQAAGLRRMLQQRPVNLLPLAVVRGQSTGWIAQLAGGLQELGRNPVVVDAARGAAASAFGLRPRGDLMDMLEGRESFDNVAHRTREGVHVLRGDRGVEAFAASGEPPERLLAGFAALSHGFDDVLLAMPATEMACMAAPADHAPVLAIESAGNGLMDSYSALKELARSFGYRRFLCVVVGGHDAAAARGAFERIAATASRFVDVAADWAGWLPPATSARARHEAACAAQALVGYPPAPTVAFS